MIRKLLMVAAVAIVPVGAVVASGGQAWANPIQAGTASCKTITGKVAFAHKLTKTGTVASSGPLTQTDTLTATLGGCTTSPAGKATSATVKGTLVSTTPKGGTAYKCTGIAGATKYTSATITVTWNKPIAPTVTKPSQDYGTTIGTPKHGEFILPDAAKGGTTSSTGSFTGTDHGATSASQAETTMTAAALLTACDTSGTSSLAIQTVPGGAPASVFK